MNPNPAINSFLETFLLQTSVQKPSEPINPNPAIDSVLNSDSDNPSNKPQASNPKNKMILIVPQSPSPILPVLPHCGALH
jgi:hypothetical protein